MRANQAVRNQQPRPTGRPRSYPFPSLAVGGYAEYEGEPGYIRAARASILNTALREGLIYRTAIKGRVLKVWRPE